ncbi:MAG: hypothetical protein OHK0019_21730 [Saprospiraceae bacterium]
MSNFLPIVVAALVPTVLGFIWYHPKVFGTLWMRVSGVTEEQTKTGNMPLLFGLALFFSLMLASVMNGLAVHDNFVSGALYYVTDGTMKPDPASEAGKWLEYYNTNLAASNHTFKHGAFHGFFLAGLFLALPIMATNALFERKSWKYVAVNASYWMVCLAIMGGILAAWK